MYASPAGFASNSGCTPDAKEPHRYTCARYGATPGPTGLHGMIMQWTPPLEAAGGVYKVCVVAQDDAPSVATRCFTFEVKRCMYCTDSESLSHVATRCCFVSFPHAHSWHSPLPCWAHGTACVCALACSLAAR